jgi:hypothetical protein
MTRLEELAKEIREKQDELNDLVDELQSAREDDDEAEIELDYEGDEPIDVYRVHPIATYVSLAERDAINKICTYYQKKSKTKISRSALMRNLCLYYIDNYHDIDLSSYR